MQPQIFSVDPYRALLIVLAVVLAGAIIVCGGLALFAYALMQVDSYPTFMADYQAKTPRSYQQAERSFSDFVSTTFPIGSAERDAIAQITKGGFQITTSTSEKVELVWKRHAGPCSEQYSIVVGRDPDGRIAKIVGQLRPICLQSTSPALAWFVCSSPIAAQSRGAITSVRC
jgi:hypothetical protein